MKKFFIWEIEICYLHLAMGLHPSSSNTFAHLGDCKFEIHVTIRKKSIQQRMIEIMFFENKVQIQSLKNI
jgi:hypothetical protein